MQIINANNYCKSLMQIMKHLVLPSADLSTAFYRMALDYRDSGDRRYYRDVAKDGFIFEDYIIGLHRNSLGIGLEEGLVPYTTFWLMDDCMDTIFGVSRLRHRLNNISQKEGGHIGYDVPPSLRGAGNATELLRLTLLKARAMGLVRALLTCDADNFASARVIEKNGGVLESIIMSDYTGKLVSRYWINL